MRKALYNLKTVTLLTGINEHTLRAWEVRHEAVSPRRSESGRRMYDQVQVDRIRTLMMLSERGHPISGIASLSDRELAKLLSDSSGSETRNRIDIQKGEHESVTDLLGFVKKFDLENFRGSLHQSMLRQGGVEFVLHTIGPLMRSVGSLTGARDISIAQEHPVSAIVKGVLFELLFSAGHTRSVKKLKQRKFIFLTMEGDHHELGILCAAVLARIAGHEAIYIGPNTPPDAAAAAANALAATDVMIGVVDMHASLLKYQASDFLDALRQALQKDVRIGFGGSARMLAGLAGRDDVAVISSLQDFQKFL